MKPIRKAALHSECKVGGYPGVVCEGAGDAYRWVLGGCSGLEPKIRQAGVEK